VDYLIQFLINNKAAAGDEGNFKKDTWTAAASHLEDFTTKSTAKQQILPKANRAR
jgi:hypothetical protein